MKAKQGYPPALILDLHYGALQVGRGLARRGIRVFGIDKLPKPVAGSSRYIKRLDAPVQWRKLRDFLISFAKASRTKPVLFPLSDYYLLFLKEHWDDLADHYCFPYTNAAIVSSLVSKVKTARLLEKLSIPHPRTIIIKRGEKLNLSDFYITFPCILKPEYHDCWESSNDACDILGTCSRVLFLNNRCDLENTLRKLAHTGDMVLQDLVVGPSQNGYYYVGYRDRKGRIILSHIGNKLRTLPDSLGSETKLRSVYNQELLEAGNEILQKLEYVGPAGIDFKYDSQSGSFYVIEINARIGINDCYLSKFGIDLAWIYYLDALDQAIEPCDNCPSGIIWYDMLRDFDWMRDYRKQYNLSWLTWLFDLLKKNHNVDALLDFRDPVPFMTAIAARIKSFVHSHLMS